MQSLLMWKSNKYYILRECVFVALGIQRAMRMPHIICGLPGHYKIFLHYIINDTIFERKKLNIKCMWK